MLRSSLLGLMLAIVAGGMSVSRGHETVDLCALDGLQARGLARIALGEIRVRGDGLPPGIEIAILVADDRSVLVKVFSTITGDDGSFDVRLREGELPFGKRAAIAFAGRAVRVMTADGSRVLMAGAFRPLDDDDFGDDDCPSRDGTSSPACFREHRSDLDKLLHGTTSLPLPAPVVLGTPVRSAAAALKVLAGGDDPSSPCDQLARAVLTAMLNVRRSLLAGDGLLGLMPAGCFGVDDLRLVLRCGDEIATEADDDLDGDGRPDGVGSGEAAVITEDTPLGILIARANALGRRACPNARCEKTILHLARILDSINHSRSEAGLCSRCRDDRTPPRLDCPSGTLVFESEGPDGAAIMYRVTAVDDCDPNPKVTCFPPPGTVLPPGSVRTVRCVARDRRGNSTCCSFEVRVVDTTPATLVCPPPIVVGCLAGDGDGAVVEYPLPAVTDLAGGDVEIVCDPPSGSFFPLGVTTVTCKATDAAGNIATCTFTVEVRPDVEPALICPQAITVECTGPDGAPVKYPSPVLSNTCETPADLLCSPAAGSVFPIGASTVSCKAAGPGGVPLECSIPVEVVDTRPPSIVCPQDITVECSSPDGTPVGFQVSASDTCDPEPIVICDPPAGSGFPLGATTVTCTAIDAAGNTSQCEFVVTVVDTVPPVITCPQGPITVSCNLNDPAGGGASVTYPAPMATDACEVSVSCTPPSGSIFPLGLTTVECTATDAAGNTAACSFDVEVVDGAAPALVCVEDLVVECTSAEGAIVDYPPPVVANECNGKPIVVCSPPPGSLFPIGSTLVTCVAVDQSGNESTCSFTVTVEDSTPPEIICPADQILECESPLGSKLDVSVTATDTCDPAPVVTCTPPLDGFFPTGVTTVECVATDRSGNRSTCTFNVSVVDTIPPVISCPADVTLECQSPEGTPFAFAVSAADTCTEEVTVSCDPAPGSLFPLGTTTVTCTAADAAGNQSTCQFDVTVADTTAPEITCSQDAIVIECDQPGGGTARYPVPVASDNCDAAPVIECDPPVGTFLVLGKHTVTCTATDAAGNSSSCSFQIEVVDTAPPDLVCLQDIVRECGSAEGSIVEYSLPTATDTCDPAPNLVCLPPPGSLFPPGTTTVTCTADDASGNLIQCTFDVIIRDTTPPIIQCPGDIVTDCDSPDGTAVNFGVSAADLCDPNPIVTCTPPSGSRFPLGTTVVTCTAVDRAGNESTCTFTVTVADTQPPLIVCPPSFERECRMADGAIADYPMPSVFDDCDPSPQLECTPQAGTTLPLGAHMVSCRATDAAGNEATCEFTITVVDTTKPELICPPSVLVECEGPDGTIVDYPLPVMNDTCAGEVPPVVTCTPPPGSVFPLGDTEVLCSAVDAEGNTAECSFIVSVVDTTPPRITCPAPIVTECTSPDGVAVSFDATVTDVCDPAVEVVCDPPSGTVFAVGQSAVVCRAVDASGNREVCAFTVTVVDRTPPALTCPADITALCTTVGEDPVLAPVACTAVVDWELPVAADDCQLAGIPVFVDATPPPGTRLAMGMHTITVRARDTAGNETTCQFTVDVVRGPQSFHRADSNADGDVDIADPITSISYLFLGGPTPPCLDAADANDDGDVDIGDPIFTLAYIFLGSTRPHEPFLVFCGLDPTDDDGIGCDRYPLCDPGAIRN